MLKALKTIFSSPNLSEQKTQPRLCSDCLKIFELFGKRRKYGKKKIGVRTCFAPSLFMQVSRMIHRGKIRVQNNHKNAIKISKQVSQHQKHNHNTKGTIASE